MVHRLVLLCALLTNVRDFPAKSLAQTHGVIPGLDPGIQLICPLVEANVILHLVLVDFDVANGLQDQVLQ
jgi:hypothetical protein